MAALHKQKKLSMEYNMKYKEKYKGNVGIHMHNSVCKNHSTSI